ncbi:MAG: N4-gp56 family major capsid protein [Clostridia bacterium]|nr:N4-gp56 family major capsid protein [Clostridia bacterium]
MKTTKFDIQRFAAGAVVNTTTGTVNNATGELTSPTQATKGGFTYNGLTPEMKTYYSDYLVDVASPDLVHEQFGQKEPIPKNGGKTINFRIYDPLPKITTPLAEGVTPDGQKVNVGDKSVTVSQFGGYMEYSDIVALSTIDNHLVQATELIGNQAGRSIDTVVREVLNAGTNVQYADGSVDARYLLTSGKKLTVDMVRRAVRTLKKNNTPKIDGYYIGIIHPDVAYDLMNDQEWKYPHQYKDTDTLYTGEIGKIAGVRFVETTEAKIFHAPDLGDTSRTLTAGAAELGASSITVSENITGLKAGRKLIIGSYIYTVASVSSKTITIDGTLTAAVTANTTVYPGEAGDEGRDVYSTLILGSNAYGVTEIEGGGLEHILKPLGSGGSCDPLNQRGTVGWKATRAVTRLVESYMVRVETASTFNDLQSN